MADRCEDRWNLPEDVSGLLSKMFERDPDDLGRCSTSATTVYDGKRMCERHANMAAGQQQLRDEARYRQEDRRG